MSLQIIFINEKNDKITFTKDELQTLLEDAYQKGYEDGSKRTITTPSIDPITYPPNIYKTTPDPNPWWNQPYCTTSDTSGNDTKTVISATWTNEDVLNNGKYYTASGEKIIGDFNTVCIDNTKSSI